jgi:hypothetical protein
MSARVFAPALDAVVATDFIHAGVQCKRGDSFPHRELKLTDLALRGLWMANLIDFVMPARPPVPAPIKQQNTIPPKR